jgi:hypothetical protein
MPTGVIQRVSIDSQSGWRWCQKCQGLVFAGGSSRAGSQLVFLHANPGPCFAGAKHDTSRSAAYAVPFARGGAGMHSRWAWCYKCQGLYSTVHKHGHWCPAGDKHDGSRSPAYAVPFGPAGAGMQAGWAWCKSCTGLFYALNPDAGACVSGTKHNRLHGAPFALAMGSG